MAWHTFYPNGNRVMRGPDAAGTQVWRGVLAMAQANVQLPAVDDMVLVDGPSGAVYVEDVAGRRYAMLGPVAS